MNWMFVFIIVLVLSCEGNVYDRDNLCFKSNKKFKIIQFTDLHWNNDINDDCIKTKELVESIIISEKPDLLVFTGDIVVKPAKDGWKSLMKIISDFNVKFTVTIGNHDDEGEWTRDDIFNYLDLYPNFIGKKGPPNITGVGNFCLEIKKNDVDSIANILYFLDSNAYGKSNVSKYDWIKFNQILWYTEKSRKYTLSNNNVPIPSFAFFHIPLPEFKNVVGDSKTMGLVNEKVSSPEVNSGLFTKFIEQNDVKGVFVGHDHINNYIGIYKGIALAYGQCTGYSAYGDFGKGARIIELYEGEKYFNTWLNINGEVKYKYNYPFGYSFDDNESLFLPAMSRIGKVEAGVIYKWENPIIDIDGETKTELKGKGVLKEISLNFVDSKSDFTVDFSGLLKIDHKDLYSFDVVTNDGVKIFIDGKLVLEHNIINKKDTRYSIGLLEGYHNFRLKFLKKNGKNKLKINMFRLNGKNSIDLKSAFFYESDRV